MVGWLCVGLLIITIVASIIQCCRQKPKTSHREQYQLNEITQENGQEESEQNKGVRIAFWQEADDRIERNQALFLSEVSRQGSIENAMIYLKVSSSFLKFFFSLEFSMN